MNSQTKIKFDDSPRIGICGCVDSNQKNKVKLRVMSSPLNGRRRWPATWSNMVRRWCTTRAQYKMLEGDRRGSGGPVAHRDTPDMVRVEDCCPNWSWLRRFWRGATEGSCELPAIGISPTRFLQRGHLTRRDRAPELLGEAQGDLHQRRPATTGARVSVLEENLKGAREKENRTRASLQRRRTAL
jgi:hypothetical protein